MKKIAKTILATTCVATLCAGIAVVAGCGSETVPEGEAYGLVHGAGYVGCATVSLDGNKITDVTLQEVCLPTYVVAGDSVPAADKVTVTVQDHGKDVEKTYYKSVSYGKVKLTYDAEKKDYVQGSKTFKELMGDEVSAMQYFKAVMENKVYVTVNGKKQNDVLNKKALSKDENGYWTKTDKDGNSYSRWKLNRDATVKYVKDNGVDKLLSLEKSTTKADDVKENIQVTYWTDGTVVTGATWTDMNTTKEGSISYAKLIKNAYDSYTK